MRVNAAAPAGTRTEEAHLLGMSDPLDAAHAVPYLASDESKTATGHILRIDSDVSIPDGESTPRRASHSPKSGTIWQNGKAL